MRDTDIDIDDLGRAVDQFFARASDKSATTNEAVTESQLALGKIMFAILQEIRALRRELNERAHRT